MNQNHFQQLPLADTFLGLLIKNVGEGKFTQGEFQDIKAEEEPEQDFGFEEEKGTGNQDKQLFRKSIALGPEKRPTVSQHPPSLTLNKYLFVYGSNPGPHSVTLISGKLCRGIGVNIFFEGKIYSGHNYELTYLNYDKNLKILISGAQGKCPELKLWKTITTEDSTKLQPYNLCKLNLPMSSTGIGFAWLHSNDCLAVITRNTLHSNCQLFTFDLKTGKRSVCQGKLGKVLNMLSSSPVLVLNQEGICELVINQKNETITTLIHKYYQISAFEITAEKDMLIVGSLNGTMEAIELSKKSAIKSVSSHSKGVIFIRSLGSNLFVSSGNDRRLILHRIDSQLGKVIKLSQIELSSICLNIMPKSTSLICLLKNADIIQVSFTQDSIKLVTNPLATAMIYSPHLTPTVIPQIAYNKYNKKYIYSLSDTAQICALGFDEHCQLVSAKKTELSHLPSQLDIHGTTVAYVYQEDVSSFKSAFKSKIGSVIKKDQEKQENLVLEDYTSKKIVASMKLQSGHHCTKLKFNPQGDKLALGFQTGLVTVYKIEKSQDIIFIASSSVHSSPITDLLWSTDTKILKSISSYNMVYLSLLPEKQTMSPVYTAKGIRQHEWKACGKFDWKTFLLWDGHRNLPEDVTDVKETSEYLLACMANGALKVYRNPAGKEGQELTRLFNKPFLLQVIKEDDLRFWVVVAANGVVCGLQIGEDFCDEDQNGSFQELQQ